MNTSTSLIALINDASGKYSLYSSIFVLTVGLISNFSLILVFITLRAFRHNQCALFLRAESMANIGLLLSNFPTYIYTFTTGHDPALTSVVWCKMQSSISQIFGLCSLFTICFLTFDQFMSTNPRPNWRQISTFKLARRLILLNVCFVVLHSIPFFILTKIDPTDGCTIYNIILHSYFIFFYYPVLSSTIPVIVTITFSLLAYRNVRRIVRRQITLVRRRLDRQLTVMVLARVASLILLGLPYIIYSLYRLNLSKTGDNQLKIAIAGLVAVITFSLLYINFSINFYLFLIVSSRFRRQVKHLFVKKFWNLLRRLCVRGRNRVRVAPATVHRDVSSAESA